MLLTNNGKKLRLDYRKSITGVIFLSKDILINSYTTKEHDQLLEEVLKRLLEYEITPS